jgi:hypothetical protein
VHSGPQDWKETLIADRLTACPRSLVLRYIATARSVNAFDVLAMATDVVVEGSSERMPNPKSLFGRKPHFECPKRRSPSAN